jgi:hypothetical protein
MDTYLADFLAFVRHEDDTHHTLQQHIPMRSVDPRTHHGDDYDDDDDDDGFDDLSGRTQRRRFLDQNSRHDNDDSENDDDDDNGNDVDETNEQQGVIQSSLPSSVKTTRSARIQSTHTSIDFAPNYTKSPNTSMTGFRFQFLGVFILSVGWWLLGRREVQVSRVEAREL